MKIILKEKKLTAKVRQDILMEAEAKKESSYGSRSKEKPKTIIVNNYNNNTQRY